MLYRATAIERNGVAALIEGPSGSGKSDLALRCITRGARLVSDDYVELGKRGGNLFASPPKNIAGKIEVRGVGIQTLPFSRDIPVAILISLRPGKEIPRHPDKNEVVIEGIRVAKFTLNAFEGSAPDKVFLLLDNRGKI